MSAPDILTVARWLQDRHGLYVFAVDHPGRPECGGSHRECDGQRGKHPRGQWSRLATLSPRLIRAQLAGGPWNIGIACKQSCLLVVDEDRPGAFAAFAASIGQVVEPTFAVTPPRGATSTTGRTRGRRSATAAGSWPGTASTSAAAAPATAGTSSVPAACTQTGVRLHAGGLRRADPAGARLARRGAAPGPAAGSCTRCRTSGEHVRGAARPGPRRPRRRPRSATGTTRLYWASCRAAEMVSAGEVDEATATGLLVDAATRTGLPETEARRTIASGLRTGGRARRQAAHDGEAGRGENPAADEGRTPPRARAEPGTRPAGPPGGRTWCATASNSSSRDRSGAGCSQTCGQPWREKYPDEATAVCADLNAAVEDLRQLGRARRPGPGSPEDRPPRSSRLTASARSRKTAD